MDCRSGITPAHAGKSIQRPAYTRPLWDHPRMGGEKSSLSSASLHGPGSPPRGRGKGFAAVGGGLEQGITPAWAGKRIRRPDTERAYWDHPRVGGEKVLQLPVFQSPLGSPPHRRGKGYREFGIDISDRITPAQAGKSCSDCRCSNRRWDHPRIGGEKCTQPRPAPTVTGSPPHRRGKDKAEHLVQHHIGITPAQAGKS